jgi:fucose permease
MRQPRRAPVAAHGHAAAGAATVPLTAGFLIVYPRAESDPAVAEPESPAPGGLARLALRQSGVLLGAALLAVYVGLELGVGNWAFGYVVEARGQTEVFAGYAVSGSWFGLTVGRFLLGPIVTRLGLTAAGLMHICLAGVTVINALTWLLPGKAAATAGLILLGFFLGPTFPPRWPSRRGSPPRVWYPPRSAS